jgi:HD-GYP domain-containing protein (c-di-GMP phosphodiesterase class II)
MLVAAAVIHPQRPDVELLSPGVTLDGRLIARMQQIAIPDVWIHHDAVADLDLSITTELSDVRLAAYAQIKNDFANIASRTIGAGQVVAYRQTVMSLITELTSNRKLAGFTDRLFQSGAGLFAHCANVSYLALIAGIELETYIVRQRDRLDVDHARDLTPLGLGAMFHDIGKVTLDPALGDHHEVSDADEPQGYREHVIAGYRLLSGTQFPASATQAVLNHHQRYDGEGWPDMAIVTNRRRAGTQKGRDIHIFSRIVAVANALDNLLRDAQGSRRPPVAALHDLASERFARQFDPLVRRVMLRRMPPFAMGAQVRLSDGRAAAVVAPNVGQPCKPTVKLLTTETRDGTEIYPTIALAEQPRLQIVEVGGVDVRQWLYHLPDDSDLRALKVG